nr:ORF1 [Torque teno arctocephalus australis virus]
MSRLPQPHSRMAFYYRRRKWFPYFKRRWHGRRRRFYRQRAYRRRRYHRRTSVRNRKRRRLRRRRQPAKNRVVVWNPPRAAKCTIRGWDIGIACVSNVFSAPFESISTWQDKKYYNYIGGGVSVRAIGLRYLYEKNLSKQNIWSKSNDGFDLARYWGCTVRLYTHPFISYIFWWDNEFGDIEEKDYTHLHPATLLLERKHRVIMLSSEFTKRRRRRVHIPPPSTSESKWYSQSSWCNVNVVKFGFVPVNFKTPFWHSGQHSFAVWIGFGDLSKKDPAMSIPYDKSHFINFNREIMYRWYWDDGSNNAVLINNQGGKWKQSNVRAKAINVPYYEYFWGKYPQGHVVTDKGGDRGNIDSPDIVGIFWYADLAIRSLDGKLVIDRQVGRPSDLQIKEKIWVFLSKYKGSELPETVILDTDNKLPTVFSVGTVLNSLCSTSPFAIHGLDSQPANVITPVNIPFFYSFRWQWGGAPWSPTEPKNPCPQHGAGTDYGGVQLSDPATVAISNLHPWDLDQQGVLTREGLSRLLYSIFTPGTPPLLAKEKPKKESQEKEGGESPGPSSSSSSGDSETSGETTETEAEEKPPPPNRAVARRLRRLEQLFQRDKLFRRNLKRILKSS